MSFNKIHSLGGPGFHGSVPFSWEDKPGISKSTKKQGQECPKVVGMDALKLPPPPCPQPTSSSNSPKLVGHGLDLPLPPCPFQPTLRSGSKKGLKVDDPFLVALKECTKSVGQGPKHRKVRNKSMFSCKNSCGVREDSLVSLARSPHHHHHLCPCGDQFPAMNSRKTGWMAPKTEAGLLIYR